MRWDGGTLPRTENALRTNSVSLPNEGHHTGLFRVPNFPFESGVHLDVDIAYETWGALNSTRSNAVVICHALTGNAHVSSEDGWWNGLVGPGKHVDTNRYFVIASNVLGGCNGSSGPGSIHPDGQPYGIRFPLVTVRDMVRAQMALVDGLGVSDIEWVMGGSLGGMQTWEWALMAGSRVKNAAVIAAQPAFTALGIGYNQAMRQAIMNDPDWNAGNYYATGRSPCKGLSVARTIGMLTYRSEALFEARFGRGMIHTFPTLRTNGCVRTNVNDASSLDQPVYDIECYLQHQGQKLVERFDANSYLYLTRAMDAHDIGVGRNGIKSALATCSANVTVIGIDSDYLYQPNGLRQTVEVARSVGVNARYAELSSVYGHDAFLVEQSELGALIFN